MVTDIGLGDAGKGSVVDFLTRELHSRLVVRFSGGSQAAHNVVTDDGRHHTFAQFGAGTLAGARTFLSRFMLVDPFTLTAEAAHLEELGVADPLSLVSVDPRALVTTPLHVAANRARIKNLGAWGTTCGLGIGETTRVSLEYPELAPRVSDAASPGLLAEKLAALADALTAELGQLELPPLDVVVDVVTGFTQNVELVGEDFLTAELRRGPVLFEGSQGVLLDQWWGTHPFTTWSSTTSENARTLLEESRASAFHLGVTRSYSVRHGAGPLVGEGLGPRVREAHNATNAWQGRFRTAPLDLVTARYSLAVDRPDALALTHLDVAVTDVVVAHRMSSGERTSLPLGEKFDLDARGRLTDELNEARPVLAPVPDVRQALESGTGLEVVVTSKGPTSSAKEATSGLARQP